LLQIFFGNARNGHGPYCDRPVAAVSTLTSHDAIERQHARLRRRRRNR
jgi:hypothetical protein